MEMSKLALGLACAFALSLAAPVHARDDQQQANPGGAASSDEAGRAHRQESPAKANAETSQSAQTPLPQGSNTMTTDPAESQVTADPKKSKAKRDPAAQKPADTVEAAPASADAHADGARGPRGDDDSRARANVPEYQGPVQKPGETADPNVKAQEPGHKSQ
jgi:hypothetical protein